MDEDEVEAARKGSEEEDSGGETEQKERKAEGDPVRDYSDHSDQFYSSSPITSDLCQVGDLSADERQSLLRNELRPAIKPFKGNKLLLRFATQG